MAGYREHISVSGLLGFIYGSVGIFLFGFSVEQAILGWCLCWLAGMLPDLDSKTGRPVREIFGLLAIAVPVLLIRRIANWMPSPERLILTLGILYVVIRYGGAALLGKFAVHRGMFHSIPAMLIAAGAAFLVYDCELSARCFMAGAVGSGFLSHLVLDEMYSVTWSGLGLKLNSAAGSAIKMGGKNLYANLFTYALLALVAYGMAVEIGYLPMINFSEGPDRIRQAMEPIRQLN